MVNKTQKIWKEIRYILMWVFVLLMAVQVVLGIGWAAANMGHLALFGETSFLVEASEHWILDEYMGILYPILIFLARGIESVIPIPYYTLLYVVQLIVAGYASRYLLQFWGGIEKCNRLKKALIMGYLLTFPQLLQLHLAVLPYSLAMSVGILLVYHGLYYLRHMDEFCGSALIRLCGLWLLEVLLLPDYRWLAGVFVVGILAMIFGKNKQWRLRILVSFLCTILCFGVVANTTQTPGSMGRIQKSVSAALLARFVWPDYVTYSFFWPEEVADTFDNEELANIGKYAEETVYHFGYIMDEKYGRDTANDLYWDMVKTAFGLDTKKMLRETSRDYAAYLFPQIAFQWQMRDNYGSLLAWNYGRLQEQAPVLTKYYVRCSFAGWNVMCILGLWMIVISGKRIKVSLGEVILGISLLFMAFWYTMQGAGIQDYKNVMLIGFLWLLPVVKGYLCLDSSPH